MPIRKMSSKPEPLGPIVLAPLETNFEIDSIPCYKELSVL